jgi:carboxylesterase
MSEVLAGAEPFSHAGNEVGVLVCHGFTGSPQSMRPLAEALAAAGFTVELPLWPGHGTSIEDMLETRWSDWSAAAEAAYQDLAGRCDKVVVAGLSMGGTLTAWLASRHPEIAGAIFINAAISPVPREMAEMIKQLAEQGPTFQGIGNDVADPDVKELAYEGTPIEPLLSLIDATHELAPNLANITCPCLIFTSPQDHVVEPSNSDLLAADVSGPVERVTLERSYHVATIDYDKDLIAERSVDWVRKVTA